MLSRSKPKNSSHNNGNLCLRLTSPLGNDLEKRCVGRINPVVVCVSGALWDNAGRSPLEGVCELRQQQHGERSGSNVCQGDICW